MMSAIFLVSLYAHKYAEINSSFNAFKYSDTNSLRLVTATQQESNISYRQKQGDIKDSPQAVAPDSVLIATIQSTPIAVEYHEQDGEPAIEKILSISKINEIKDDSGLQTHN